MSRDIAKTPGDWVELDRDPSTTWDAYAPTFPSSSILYQNLGNLPLLASSIFALEQFLPSWPLLSGQKWVGIVETDTVRPYLAPSR